MRIEDEIREEGRRFALRELAEGRSLDRWIIEHPFCVEWVRGYAEVFVKFN